MHYLPVLAYLIQILLFDGAFAFSKGFTLGSHTPQVISAPSPNVVSTHVLSLNRKKGSKSAHFLSAIKNNQQTDGLYKYGSSPLIEGLGGEVYLAEISLGNETFKAIVDTGSSDTWLVQTGFRCLNVSKKAHCKFGATYNLTEEFRQIPNEIFNITYNTGESLAGIFGIGDVTLAGITVNQQIAIVNSANWQGDGVCSGIIGLAYPSLTSAYQDTDPTQISGFEEVQYNPVFMTMIADKLVKPVFSLALERGGLGGYLALGGLPPVPFVKRFARTPIQFLTLKAHGALTQYSFYVITTNGFEYAGSRKIKPCKGTWPNPMKEPANDTDLQMIVDSGTTLNYLPKDLANDINSKFIPAAKYDSSCGEFIVNCDAKAPHFGVVIGGELFRINLKDMILNKNGTCVTGITDGGEGPYILGDVFLRNVIAVFDVGAAEMRFASREYYYSSES